MNGWFGKSARADAIEGELAALREALAGRAADEAERARTLRETVEALAARLTASEERYEGVLPELAAALARLERLETGLAGVEATRSDPAGSDPARVAAGLDELRASLLRIDRQLRAQAEQADTVSLALLERIEALRDRRGDFR